MQNLQNWINHTALPSFDNRILAIDDKVLEICTNLHIPNPLPQHDVLIISTAIAYDLILVTRNLAYFKGMPVKLLNPFS